MKRAYQMAMAVALLLATTACGEAMAPEASERTTGWESSPMEEEAVEFYQPSGPQFAHTREEYVAEVVAAVNEVRAQGADCGQYGSFGPSDPLTLNDKLADAALDHSIDQASRGELFHADSEGRRFFDRTEAAGYEGIARGENVAGGYEDPASVVEGWRTSPGHCMVMMMPAVDEIGVGYYFKPGTPHGHYWTMIVGHERGRGQD